MKELLTEERVFRVRPCAICGCLIARGAAVTVLRTRHAFGLLTHTVTHVRCPMLLVAASVRRESGAA